MMGAPTGNTNSAKHGLRSKRSGLVHAKLGRRFASAYGHCNSLRKAVESLLEERQGGITLCQRAKTQTLLRLEEGIRALEKTMSESPNMDPAEVRQSRYAVVQWSAQRDALLAELVGEADQTKGQEPMVEVWSDDPADDADQGPAVLTPPAPAPGQIPAGTGPDHSAGPHY